MKLISRFILAVTFMMCCVLSGCSQIKVNTLPEPPPTNALRVYFQPLSGVIPNGAWRSTSHKQFVIKQASFTKKILREVGYFELISEQDIIDAIGNEELYLWDLKKNDWELARKIGKAVHADYVMIGERGAYSMGQEAYWTAALVNVETGKAYGGSRSRIIRYLTQGENKSAEWNKVMRESYREIFSEAKGDLLATAIKKKNLLTEGKVRASEAADAAEALAKKQEEERLAAARIAREQAEKERLAAEELARKKQEEERLLVEKIARQKAEQERIAAEELARKKLEEERKAAEKAALAKAEEERRAAEELARRKREEGKLALEKAAREKAEQERLAAEELARQKQEEERQLAEKLAREKTERERLAAEELARRKQEEGRLAREIAAREKAERERFAAEELARKKLEEERQLAEKLAREKAEQARAAEALAMKKLEEERQLAEKLAREKAARERIAAEELARDRLAEEQRRAEVSLAEDKAGKQDTGKVRVVVYDLESAELLRPIAMILSEALREELIKLGRFQLVNRENLAKVLQELELRNSGLIDEKQAVQLGKGVSAKEVVTGRLGSLGKSYVLQAKRINAESFRTIAIESLKSSQGEEEHLLEGIPALATRLSKGESDGI